jgi:hypothetical protein
VVVRAKPSAAIASASRAGGIAAGESDTPAMEPDVAREPVRRAGLDGVEVLVDMRERAVPIAAVVEVAAAARAEPPHLDRDAKR